MLTEEEKFNDMVKAVKSLPFGQCDPCWVAHLVALGAASSIENFDRRAFFIACSLDDPYLHSIGSTSSSWLNP